MSCFYNIQNMSATTLQINSLPKLNSMFSNSKPLIPDFEFGEIHVVAVESMAWRKDFLSLFFKTTPTCVITDTSFSESFIQQVEEMERTRPVKLVELKHKKKPNFQRFVDSLKRVSKHYPLIYIEIDGEKSSSFAELMMIQQGLLELRAWARKHHKVIVCLMVGSMTEYPLTKWVVTAGSMASSLSLLYRGEHCWHWTIEHWYDDADVITRNLIIDESTTDKPRLELQDVQQSNFIAPFSQQDQVWFSHHAIRTNETYPTNWVALNHLDDWEKELPEVTPGCILIALKPGSSLISMAHIVYEMRAYFGRETRIFVREIKKSLRHEDENLLLRAGATMVIPFELSLSRIFTFIDNTVGWHYSRPLAKSLEKVLIAHEKSRAQGYLPPSRFVKETGSSIDYAQVAGVHCALIKAQPVDGLDLVQIAAQFNNRRDGDVLTIVNDLMYIFLYACRESDIEFALKLLMGLPTSTLFEAEARFTSPFMIKQELQVLTTQLEMIQEVDNTQALLERRQRDPAANKPVEPGESPARTSRPQKAKWGSS